MMLMEDDDAKAAVQHESGPETACKLFAADEGASAEHIRGSLQRAVDLFSINHPIAFCALP